MSGTERAIISHAFKDSLNFDSIKGGVSMRFRFADEMMMKQSLEYIRKKYGTRSLIITSGLSGDIESLDYAECILTDITLNIGQDHDGDTISFSMYTGLENIFSSEIFPLSIFYGEEFIWSFHEDKDRNVSTKIKYSKYGTQKNIDPFPYDDDWVKFILGGYSAIDSHSSATNRKNEKNIEFTQSSDKHQNTSPMPSKMGLISCEEVKIGDDPKKIKLEWDIYNGEDSALCYERYSDLFRLEINTDD